MFSFIILRIFKSPLLYLALAAIVFVYLPFDWQTQEQKLAARRIDKLTAVIKGRTKLRMAYDLSAAATFARVCGFHQDDTMFSSAATISGFKSTDIEQGGSLYEADRDGNVEVLDKVVASAPGPLSAVCAEGMKKFGPMGTSIPGLVE